MAMPDIYDEIFQYSKVYIKNKSNYLPYVYKDTPQEKNKFPLVIIKQIDDPLYDENLDKTDQKFDITYEVEIYSVDNGNVVKQVITNEITKLVNDVFDEHYGFARKSNRSIPNIDLNVDRRYMRFEAKIDENKKIYRR